MDDFEKINYNDMIVRISLPEGLIQKQQKLMAETSFDDSYDEIDREINSFTDEIWKDISGNQSQTRSPRFSTPMGIAAAVAVILVSAAVIFVMGQGGGLNDNLIYTNIDGNSPTSYYARLDLHKKDIDAEKFAFQTGAVMPPDRWAGLACQSEQAVAFYQGFDGEIESMIYTAVFKNDDVQAKVTISTAPIPLPAGMPATPNNTIVETQLSVARTSDGLIFAYWKDDKVYTFLEFTGMSEREAEKAIREWF